jgi:hypothetical protein
MLDRSAARSTTNADRRRHAVPVHAPRRPEHGGAVGEGRARRLDGFNHIPYDGETSREREMAAGDVRLARATGED